MIAKHKPKGKKSFVIFGTEIPSFLAAFLFVLFISTVFFAIETTVLGGRLAKLEIERSELAAKNTELSNQLVKSTSLNSIQEKTGDLGYTKPEQIIYITQEDVVARLP
jgi:hypothetical protein